MLATLRQKLRMNGSQPLGRAEWLLVYLATHGITILLLAALLLSVILLE